MYKIFKTEKSWIEGDAIEQIKSLSKLKGVESIIGYPDLHPGKTPIGVSIITNKIIYPHLIGNDIGCSVSLFETSMNKKKFKIKKAMKLLSDFRLGNLNKANFNLGTIGAGNHFAEFTTIDKFMDETDACNFDKDKVYLLVHSGSRGLGEAILRQYVETYSCQNGLIKGSEGFDHYLLDYKKAINFAKENRQIIAQNLCNALNIENVNLKIEAVHNGLEIKNDCIIHRKGAANALEKYIVIAGSRGDCSYIVKPINACISTGFSVAHGAGRKWKRSGAKEKLQGKFSKKDIRNLNFPYNLICSDINLVYEEAPEAYKSIDRVINDLLSFNLIKVIAKLKPQITYKN
ncbi:RNA ligase RtcB family protein [Clostridium felsineum]|uniref:RNA ligase RtcB family protein n=1 Tax=Clostridium felsineum TaxID=36839 RepID=UPI00098BFC8E|nr:RNA ligase RtcB family protein [Clostridium felsineum]URZ14489.1 RNA-splicing ligase RtcB [Clostridium felsineum DSM 794]